MQEAHEQAEVELDSSCPTCGVPAERGQLVCLECGSRIALAYRRPPSWRIPVAITVVVGALAVAGAVFAYEAISDEAKDEVAATPLKPKRPATEKPVSATTGEGLVRKGGLYTWPKGLRAFTVVLLSTEDRPTAISFANSVAAAKAAKAGVIRSNDFDSLPKGLFVVFAGSYETRARADRATARLTARYQGGFTQLVRR